MKKYELIKEEMDNLKIGDIVSFEARFDNIGDEYSYHSLELLDMKRVGKRFENILDIPRIGEDLPNMLGHE